MVRGKCSELDSGDGCTNIVHILTVPKLLKPTELYTVKKVNFIVGELYLNFKILENTLHNSVCVCIAKTCICSFTFGFNLPTVGWKF